jgi:quercetin dioxygenase-like cupin family protein
LWIRNDYDTIAALRHVHDGIDGPASLGSDTKVCWCRSCFLGVIQGERLVKKSHDKDSAMSDASQNSPGTESPRVHQPDEDRFRVIHSENIVWKAFAAFPAAARLAILVGNPTLEGPYLIRVKLPEGTRMAPHRHPEDRVYTVISGTFYIGLGDRFDESKLTAHPPGSVLVLPGGQPHFHWAKSGDYVTQVSAIGPLGLKYVTSTDDPRSGAPSATGPDNDG